MPIRPMSEVLLHLRKAVVLHEGPRLTDAQLLGDFIDHQDETALNVLVQRHGPMVWGVCRRHLRSHHDAEDAFQATFLILVRKAASIAPREMVANWLYGVARRTALKAQATAARRKARESPVMELADPRLEERNLWKDLEPLLDQELGRLPDKYRIVMLLCDLEGKSRKEAAQQLCCPEGTVAGRLARARTLLAKRLARHGLAISAGSLAVVLGENVATAQVPAAITAATIRAAKLLAAGQAVELISIQVAVLVEGVLKSMLVTKFKIVASVVLFTCLFGAGAVGLACRAQAEQQPDQAQEQPPATSGARDLQELSKELRALKEEVKRLRAENEDLRNRLPKPGEPATVQDGKQSIKVYPVAALVNKVDPETEAQSLLRVITNSIEPLSWNQAGGNGSIEYYPEGTSLVIRQSPEIQKQVQDLLDSLRQARTEQVEPQRQPAKK